MMSTPESGDEFVDVFRRSTFVERRPVNEAGVIASMTLSPVS